MTHEEPAFRPVRPARRLAALAIDAIVMGLVGRLIVMAVGEEAFAGLTWQGRLIGFVIVVAYLGVMGSALAGGQTLGKRAMKIAVVGLDGAPLPLGRSLLRAVLLATPLMLNGIPLAGATRPGPLMAVIGYVLFAGLLALAVPVLFDRAARRGGHDWAARSVVAHVPAEAGVAVPPPAGWLRKAVAAIALVMVPVAIGGVTMAGRVPALAGLVRAQQRLEGLPGVMTAGVFVNTNRSSQGTATRAQLVLQVPALPEKGSPEPRKAALAALAAAPELAGADQLVVVYQRKVDIGIYNTARNAVFPFEPKALAAGAKAE